MHPLQSPAIAVRIASGSRPARVTNLDNVRWISLPLLLLFATMSALALTPISDFSVSRYHGHWYEITAIPGFFRNKCERDVQVDYAPDESGALVVRNRCRRPDGGVEQTEGRARPLDPEVPAVLKVTFVNQLGIWWYPFGRNQIVIAAGPDYSWLVIGDPSLRYGRVIARTPAVDARALGAIAAALASEGYDRCAFTLKPQTGGREQPARLCDEVH
jgi:apolipoprotein D and lipocalin family protein